MPPSAASNHQAPIEGQAETHHFLPSHCRRSTFAFVTDKSTKLRSAGHYRLRTFGTLALTGPEDDPLPDQDGHQRRRVALLAVLSAAGEQGCSRDRLLLLFWPESAQSQARHSLEQLLYAIRISMNKAVFSGVNPLRLNSDIVSSDVDEFLRALERRDLETAVSQYRGRFLEGFYLSDSPEFEQWLDGERAQLERSYCGALEELARSAEASQQHATAVRWWRKLVDTDPVSGKNATGLMRALMNAGDEAAALQYAERYEAIVQRELGTSAGQAVANIVAEARARTKTVRKPAMADPSPVDQRDTRRSPRRLQPFYTVAAVVIIALIATAAWLRATPHRRASSPGAEPSIAVLPFENVGNQQNTAFVDGLSEELIAALARINNLRVIGRTSAFAFRNSNVGARRIADSLGVTNLLEGSVQKDGALLRVQVRLVNARDGSTRWSETYDRELKDIFSVQSEIAAAVARQLDLRFGGRDAARIAHGSTRNVAAYELYLRGNDPVLLRSDSGVREGLEYFRQALALDTSYVDAYAGLARMQWRISWDDTAMSRRDRLALAEQAALKAVAIDDSSGEAHAALSFVRKENYQFTSAERELQRAVMLEPANPQFREWLAQLYVLTERPAEALLEAQRALALDPLSAAANAEVARALVANDRCDEALAQLEKLRSLRPPLLRVSGIAAQCYAKRQMWPEAIAEMQRISANGGPSSEALLGYLLGRAGRTKEARRILEAMLARSTGTNGSAFNVATVYAGLGENDQAFSWLNKALDERSIFDEFLSIVLSGLAGDPRLPEFRRHFGLQSR